MIALLRISIDEKIIQLMFQLGVRIGEGVALKFSDIEYGKIALQRMEEKVHIFDGESFKSVGVQIVEHLKKVNDSEYHFILLTDVAKEIIGKARELNATGEFIFERNGERLTARVVTYWLSKYCRDTGITYKSPDCKRRTTASRLSTAGMPLDKIRDMLGQVDEKTILSYIYNPNTEKENLNIMNEALEKGNKKNVKKYCTYRAYISATKNPLKIKGLRKHETGFEFYPSKKTLIERDFPAHPNLTYSRGYSKLIVIKR